MTDQALPLRLLEGLPQRTPASERALVESYRRLADVFHEVLAEQGLDALLDRVANALAELIPHDSMTIYEADEPRRMLTPVLARDKWADKILADRCPFGVGLTGWGVEHREPVRVQQAQTDPLTGLYNHRSFHERLRAALTNASRSHDKVSVLMLDIDDFKRVNDVFGHGAGDEILRSLADALKSTVRASDVVCRLGGEEFAIVMASRNGDDAERLARRLVDHVASAEFEPAGRITISVGLARGPEHAMNPRELIACAEAAMMTAKAHGKNQIVLYEESSLERPENRALPSLRDVRSIAHMKMLQSLSGKLNRLNDVREIGNVIANELRSLIDYHNCRVFVVEGDDIRPIAFVGGFSSTLDSSAMDLLTTKVGIGLTGRVAATGESLLLGDAANYEYARQLPGTDPIDESIIAVPLSYGTRVIGVIVLSKLGLDQFDEDDVRLLEVLAGHASVALENASLYEAARREAERATALLEFSRELATAAGMEDVVDRIVELSARTLGSPRASVWLQHSADEDLAVRAMWGYSELDEGRLARLAFDPQSARKHFSRKEPFVVTPEEHAQIAGAAEVGVGK